MINTIKRLYIQAVYLISTDDPYKIVQAMKILHELVYEVKPSSKEVIFWQSHASVALADLYLVGVEGKDYLDEDDNICAYTIVEADLMKAFSLYRRALIRGCTDGVNAMAEIYMMLGDYKHSAELYASSVKYGYRNASDAQRALDYMLSSGKIDVIPEVYCEPDGKPTLEYLITYRP